jgi:hypothetical protein
MSDDLANSLGESTREQAAVTECRLEVSKQMVITPTNSRGWVNLSDCVQLRWEATGGEACNRWSQPLQIYQEVLESLFAPVKQVPKCNRLIPQVTLEQNDCRSSNIETISTEWIVHHRYLLWKREDHTIPTCAK